MKRSRFEYHREYKLTPPALVRQPDGGWLHRDWTWWAQPSGGDAHLRLVGPHIRGGTPSVDIGWDNIHSYQDGHLLMRAQLRIFDHGPGFDVRPFRADCRKVIEPLLARIREILGRP